MAEEKKESLYLPNLSKRSKEPKSNVYVKGSEWDHYNVSFVLKLSYTRKKMYDFKNKQQ